MQLGNPVAGNRVSNRLAAVAALLLAALALPGCARLPGQSSGLTSGQTLQAPLQQSFDEGFYQLTPGDKLKIIVFGEQELTGEFEVGASGSIAYPLIGDVPARGETVNDVRAKITNRLSAGYLRNPKVSMQVLSYRPIYVQGEVRHGGEYAFRSGLTVRDAIALAGGYSYRADSSFIYLRRQNDGNEQEVSIDGSVAVLPGDNIRIPERYF